MCRLTNRQKWLRLVGSSCVCLKQPATNEERRKMITDFFVNIGRRQKYSVHARDIN